MLTEAQEDTILKVVGEKLSEERELAGQNGNVEETERLDKLIKAFAIPAKPTKTAKPAKTTKKK